MSRKILSILIIASLLIMIIPAVPLVESIVLEKNTFRLSDFGIDDNTKSTDNSYVTNTENTIKNNLNFNDRGIVNYAGVPIWIYDSDFYVKHIKTADLNGDGIKDVIAGEYDSDLYTDPHNIYAINGLSGNTMWTYTLNDGVRSMDICDINNDGVMDVVAGASYGSPGPDGRVHAIDGTDGSYIWRFTPGGTGDTIGDIAFGDFNGDIYPDVAIACWDDYVYAINGQTGTQLWSTYIGSIFVTAVDTGDVNGDGRDDISFGNSYLPGYDNLQGVLDGTDGTTIWSQTVPYTVENTLLSDIDNDGSLEAIYGVSTSADIAEFHVRNASTGALEWSYALGPDTGLNPDVFLFSNDIDEDGDLDLIVGNEYVANYIYAFDGDSSTPMWVSEELGGFPRDMAFGDVIGDGYKNIVVATYDRVQILNATDGTKVWYYAVGGTIRAAGCADFNNDAILDVLCSGGAEIVGHDPAKSVWALKTTEESPILWEFDADEYGSAVAIDDLNGDVYMDVIGVTSNDKAWAVNGETGTELWSWTATDNLYSVVTGDFNGDGQIDVAVAGNDNIVTALYGNTGSIMWQFTTPTDYIGRKCLQSTDLNNDGKIDVIAGSKDGNVYAINGNTGTELWIQTEVTAVNEVELAQMDGYGPLDVITADGNIALVINGSNGNALWQYNQNTEYAKHVEVFDLDNDGFQDIAIGVPKMGATPGRLIMVDGLTHTELWTVYPFLPCSDYCLSNGDLNNDGIKDLIAAGNYDDKKVHAYNGTNGNELWSYETGGDVNVVKAVDLNYDGNIEVLAGSDDQYLYVFKGDGSVFWSISTADDVIHIALGDISGDGYPNIALITFGFDAIIYAFRSFYEGLPPIADFTYEPLTPYTYTTIFFNSTSYDQDGHIVNWTWDMDDGTILYGENVTHQYSSEGSYNVILTVTDNDGIPDSYYETINVISSLPTANFNYEPVNPAAYETVYFNSTSFSPIGNIVNWSWDLGDGNFSYGENVTHQYASNGSYSVNHTVLDDNGFTGSIIKTVLVGPLNEIPLYNGWNLITIPVQNDWWASDISGNLTGCTSVSKWNATLQTYNTYIVGGPPTFDFPIEDGYGFFVDMNQPDSLLLTGSPIDTVSISIEIGWNLLGWYHPYETTASSLSENITGCTSVSKWNATLQTYNTYIVGGPPTFDFTVSCGMGLFVDVTEESTWYGDG